MLRLDRIPLFRRLREFGRDRRGLAAVEFAVLSSVLTLALLGGTELSRLTLMHQKMDRVSSSVADWVAQSTIIAPSDFTNFYDGANQVAKPFELGDKGFVIISFIIAETDTTYRVSWQRSGAGTFTQPSQIGVEGGIAALPAGVTLKKGDYMVGVEVYAKYEPFIFPDLVGTVTVYKRSYEQPRSPDIITLSN